MAIGSNLLLMLLTKNSVFFKTSQNLGRSDMKSPHQLILTCTGKTFHEATSWHSYSWFLLRLLIGWFLDSPGSHSHSVDSFHWYQPRLLVSDHSPWLSPSSQEISSIAMLAPLQKINVKFNFIIFIIKLFNTCFITMTVPRFSRSHKQQNTET